MVKYIKKHIMAFKDIFKDDNDINEKSVIGFLSFAVVWLGFYADSIPGIRGKEFVITDTIFNSFVIITLGCFGIAGAEKIFGKK